MTDSPNPTNTGDNDSISATIGPGATNVVVGKQITQNIGLNAEDVAKIVEQVQQGRRPAQQAVSITALLAERERFEPELVLIEAGAFLMGSQPAPDIPAAETQQHQVTLAAYAIGKYPVTNEQYAEFVRQTGYSVAPASSWALAPIGQQPPAGKEQQPVVGVSWDDAVAYCGWLHERTGRAYRLPSEAEWEKAACRDYGCADMIGNIKQWTSTGWGRKRTTPDFGYPYRADDGRERLTAERGPYREYRVCRGGAAANKQTTITCTSRTCALADSHDKQRGFRVALVI